MVRIVGATVGRNGADMKVGRNTGKPNIGIFDPNKETVLKTKIEKFYKARIDYECETTEQIDEVFDLAVNIADGYEIDVTGFMGNAACSPYINLEGENLLSMNETIIFIEQFIENNPWARFL